MSIQQNIDYHAQSLADTALSAKDPQIIQSILGNLTKSIQNGTVKPYVGIPLVQSINDHLQTVSQQADMMAALRSAPQVPPEQSIGSQTLASAEPSQGIDTAQSNLPTQMAGGGIVAFDDGGEVESYANKGYVEPTDYSAPYGGNRYTDPNFDSILKGYQAALPGIIQKYKRGMDLSDTEKGAVQFLKKNDAIPATLESFFTAEPVVPVGLNAITPIPSPAVVPPKTPAAPPKKDTGIIIHDDKKAAPPADAIPTTQAPAEDYLKTLIEGSKKDRQDLKDLILGDEGERAKDRTIDLYTQALKAGFKMMSGTSPYAAANVGPAGEEFATGIAGVLSKERDEKTKRVGQLVALGLKGQELDAELAKLGVTKDYYDAHKKLFEAQAYHYRHPTSTAGLGSVAGNVVQSELDRIEGYRAKPTSAPFFTSLPLDVQTALAKTDPKSASYQRAMEVFNTKANEYANRRLGIMRAYGAKQYPTADSNEIS
jgi:hypothetical protein